MVGVHVGVYLEYKAAESFLAGIYLALHCLHRPWRRGYLYKAVKQFLHAECIESRTEEYRRQLTAQIRFLVKLRIDALYQFEVFP